jgi:hypothetical protein
LGKVPALHRVADALQVKESLGIVAGSELPRRGKCAHYGKSYRWFRYVSIFGVFVLLDACIFVRECRVTEIVHLYRGNESLSCLT